MAAEDGSFVKWGWDKWNQTPAPLILRSDRMVTSGITIDYDLGKVAFASNIAPGEEMRANYSFRLFNLEDYVTYLNMALSFINIRKPQTQYNLDQAPVIWTGILILCAYELILRNILLKLNTFRYRRLFENPDQMIATLSANAAAANAEFMTLLPTMKRRGLTMPLGIANYNWNIPYKVDETNFRNFVVTG